MADKMTMTVSAAGFIRALEKLGPIVHRKVARPAVRAGGEVIVEATRRHAKKYSKTGKYAASMGQKVVQYDASGYSLSITGPRLGKEFDDRGKIGHLVEFGHRIAKKGTGTLARKGDRLAGISKVTGKRGEGTEAGMTKAQPSMRMGFEEAKGAAVQRMNAVLAKGIEREAARLKKK